MIKIKLKYVNFIMLSLLIVACNNNNNRLEEEKVDSTIKEFTYKIDIKNTKVIWNGYKTNDKIKVVGFFKNFSSNREGKEFKTINELVTGLEFSIESESSHSGDQIRDMNLKDYFFKFLTEDFTINGRLGKPNNDSLDVSFLVFGKEKIIKLGYSCNQVEGSINNIIEIKGSINLESQFEAYKAYNSISEKCYDLHKGSDGVSRTWKEVDVLVKALVLTNSIDSLF
jgi:hypothetical protein